MESLGATIVDTDTGDVFAYTDDEFTALLYEFRAQIADYLQRSRTQTCELGRPYRFQQRTLRAKLVYYGQDVFRASRTGDGLSERSYLRCRANACTQIIARSGIDNAIAADNLDAIVAPHLTNSTGPAVSGYPNLSLPVGIRTVVEPAGMLMYSTFLHEPQLIGFGFDLEQRTERAEPAAIPRLSHPDTEWRIFAPSAAAAPSVYW